MWASPVAQMVKNLPAMQETWVWSVGWEDLLKKGVTTQSSALAWRIPWAEGPGRLQSTGSQRIGHDCVTNTFIFSYWGRTRASQLALVVKNPPASAGDVRDAVWSLGCEDPLEEGMAAHSSILAWRVPWTEEPGGLQSMGLQRVKDDWSMHTRLTHC